MKRWKRLAEGEELQDKEIVLCARFGERLEVTLGYPGWTRANNGVLAHMPVKPITLDPDGWLSEYRGDSLPDRSDWYLVSIEKNMGYGQTRIRVDKKYFDVKQKRWHSIAPDSEVLAFMPFPKPYKWREK